MEIDDGLKQLFDALDEEDQEEVIETQLGLQSKASQSELVQATEPIKSDNIDFPINEVLTVKTEVKEEEFNSEVIEESPQDLIDYNEALSQLKLVTNEILQACRADRQEAQDTAIMLRNKIDDAHALNNDASRGYLDGLVKIIEVKAGINLTAVKMMEANAKMLAATKAGMSVNINNSAKAVVKQSRTDVELTKLLDSPMSEFDQY